MCEDFPPPPVRPRPVTSSSTSLRLASAVLLAVLASSCPSQTDVRLQSVAITPGAPSIAAGTMQAFTAMGTYDDGAVSDLTLSAVWSSSDASVATVAGGVATSLAPGTTTITATDPATGVSTSTDLTVTAAVLTSLAVTPTLPGIALGTDVQLTAMGTFSDSTVQDLSATVTWSSTNVGVATVSNAPGTEGLATSVATGVTTIEATDPATLISASTMLTVTPATLVSIAVTPTAPSIALGTTQAFTATGTYSDSSVQDLTDAVTWSSTSAGVATISNAPGTEGLATSVATGVTTIEATDPSTSIGGSTSLTVTPAVLVTLAVTPTAPSIALGTMQAFTATGTYSDSSVQDLTDSVTWSSTSTGVATISNAPGTEGQATSVATGVTTIDAVDPGTLIGGSTTLTVTPAVLVSLAVTPTAPSIALGTSQAFTATGTYSDSSVQDLTDSVTWSSTSTGVATISNAPGTEGLATSVATGETTIEATEPTTLISGSTTLTVTPAVLVSIAVTPSAPSIALGTAQAFTATGTYRDSSVQDLTDTVTWSSTSTGVATISNAAGTEGLATSVATGVTTIDAVDPGTMIGGSTTLTVTPAALVSISVTPAGLSVPVGTTRQLVATGTYTDASVQDLTSSVTWSSTMPAVATVSNAGGSEGLATAVAGGGTTITATDVGSGVIGSTSLAVVAAIAFRAASLGGQPADTLALTLATPTGTQPSDVLLASIAVRPHTAAITPPGGWALVRRLDNASGNASSLAVYRRLATAGEPADHTWTFSASTGSAGVVAAFYGVAPGSPVDVEGGQSTSSGTTHAAPSVTTNRAGAMLVTAHAFTSCGNWTPPGGMTAAAEAASLPIPNDAGISLQVNYELEPVAGATGIRTATNDGAADTGNAQATALSPGP